MPRSVNLLHISPPVHLSGKQAMESFVEVVWVVLADFPASGGVGAGLATASATDLATVVSPLGLRRVTLHT